MKDTTQGYVYAHTYIYTHTRTNMYAFMYVCIFARIYVCVHDVCEKILTGLTTFETA